jgi:hypothetical protein
MKNMCRRMNLPELFLQKKAHLKRVAIVLVVKNQDCPILKSNNVIWFPAFRLPSPYPSLNLSQAVMIYAYILSGLESSVIKHAVIRKRQA